MKKSLKLFIAAAVGLLVFSHGFNTHANGKEFVFPKLEGMSIDYNYPVYTGEDLWDYINGAADGYQAYHFEQLNIICFQCEKILSLSLNCFYDAIRCHFFFSTMIKKKDKRKVAKHPMLFYW